LYEYLQQEWDREQWVYIYSLKDAKGVNPTGNGTGKSYTANAIANLLIDEGVAVLVCREVDMAAQLQATFDDRTGESEYALMGRYKAIPVLIMQDFGKQGSKSEWWPMKLYDIIDKRVISNKTTIFTSNHDITSLRVMEERFGDNHGPAIRSRLLGKCGSYQNIWRLEGPDRRLVVASGGD
jgi:DNA replication protein DnaC